jgi:tetraacyldisaccharide 4'-kinase
LRKPDGLPHEAQAIVPFAVTLEFEDAARLRKFLSDRLFKAREKKFRTRN